MYTVGKLDVDKYQCVTDDITTDEVIITDVQIQHIEENHPGDYERFADYLNEIITEPDYIIETNKPDTAVILKEVNSNGDKIRVILRLKTSRDPDNYKNSIITFNGIDDKRWDRYLRTKKILYKRE